MNKKISLFWFRRDLRLDDNVGLFNALSDDHPVLAIFIFDTEILDNLPKDDPRVTFIYDQISSIRSQLDALGSGLGVYHGRPKEIFQQLISDLDISAVYTNHDYEPYAKERDSDIEKLLSEENIDFNSFKDQVFYEKDEVVKDDGDPYVVYTPYMKTWKSKFNKDGLPTIHQTPNEDSNLLKSFNWPEISMEELGFERSSIEVPDYSVSSELIQDYEKTRNYPAKDGTSHLGPHLRFGTVSIRKMIRKAAQENNEVFWQELIWREFFMQILWHFPHTVDKAFRAKYDRIEWRNNEAEFEKWKSGTTGFPLVDAGMRQLNESGYMHNRVRMLVASFLCKHLLIDWRWGEAYFAEKLLDFELASNIGNWQWAAGSGVDAAPYFRIFNPTTQIDKFDKDHKYIKQWIPEFDTSEYPEPMVDHKEARERCLKTYRAAVQ